MKKQITIYSGVDKNGNNLGPNEQGEILLWNGEHWNGYYGQPEETVRLKDAKGWYHTGDIGHMDEDHYLFVSGRDKEILKYNLLHYWPVEIQNVILELEDVVDCLVTGIPHEEHGDEAAAVVIKRPNSLITEQDVIDHVASRMAYYQHLHAGVRFVEKLPCTPNGKSLKRDLRLLFETNTIIER